MIDFSGINPAFLIASLIVSATPILLAAIGEAIVEKAGVLNLGVEGMMITGAVVGFAVAINTKNPLFGFFSASIAAALLALIFGVLTQLLLQQPAVRWSLCAEEPHLLPVQSKRSQRPLLLQDQTKYKPRLF